MHVNGLVAGRKVHSLNPPLPPTGVTTLTAECILRVTDPGHQTDAIPQSSDNENNNKTSLLHRLQGRKLTCQPVSRET